MVVLKFGLTENGTNEYYLVGWDRYDDFDVLLNLLGTMTTKVVDTFDGIWFRTALLDKNGILFKIIWHEDVGLYAFIPGQQTEGNNAFIKGILEQVIVLINSKLRE